MSSTARTPKAARRFAMETDLAPHVEPTWAEDFVVELRLLGVAGEAIEAALSEVESHCGESAETAEQAFGDACVRAQTRPPDLRRRLAPGRAARGDDERMTRAQKTSRSGVRSRM